MKPHYSVVFFSLVMIMLSASSPLYGQWTATNGPYGGTANAFAIVGNDILAGSDNGVFVSTNGGSSWGREGTMVAGTSVYSFAVNRGKVFCRNLRRCLLFYRLRHPLEFYE